MATTINLPLLDRIDIASPCTARWEDMAGDERVRHCSDCNLNVHNLSAMTRDEAEGVLAKLAEGRVCARFFRRADGTILTRDCPVGVAAVRRRVLAATSRIAAALGLAVLAVAAAKASQDKSWGNWGWSMRLSNVAPVVNAKQKIQAAWGRAFPPVPPKFPGAWVAGGIRAYPPDPRPPVKTASGVPLGPHEWGYERD